MFELHLLHLSQTVAAKRRLLAHLSKYVADQKAAFEMANAPLLHEHRATQQAVADAEAALRAATLDAYLVTGEKKPSPGLQVKTKTVLTYDPTDAMAWAQESGLALTLDTKAFEKIAKATPIPFVAITEEPTVTIATDLDAALPVCAEPDCGGDAVAEFMGKMVCATHYHTFTEPTP